MTEAVPGDIVAVTKVDDLHIGDTVGNHAHPPKLPEPAFPSPMFGLAVEPKARGDEQKISGSLAKIANEDPTFHVSRDAQTHEMVITGMSQLHLDILRERLKRRFDVEVVTHEPKVPYRETVTAPSEASYRHKKQSGGRGQFGEVHMRSLSLAARDRQSRKAVGGLRQQVEVRENRATGSLRRHAQLRLHRHHRRRLDPESIHPGRGEGM